MIFETHEPPAAYSGLIESIFHYKAFQPDHSIERVVPTGHVFLIFELDGLARHTYDGQTLQVNATFHKAWVSGPQRNHLSISAHDDSEMFVIQFKAFGAYPFLQRSMETLADRVVPGDQFPGNGLLEMQRLLLSGATSNDKFTVADQWLDAHFNPALIPPPALVDIVAQLQTQPAAKLNEVIAAFDGTQKHLITQFKKYIGITPKQYQRVLRFNDVFVQMQAEEVLGWSDIAYRCGYSDQSHFIREFKAFSGFNPEAFLGEGFCAQAPNFFPLDRKE